MVVFVAISGILLSWILMIGVVVYKTVKANKVKLQSVESMVQGE